MVTTEGAIFHNRTMIFHSSFVLSLTWLILPTKCLKPQPAASGIGSSSYSYNPYANFNPYYLSPNYRPNNPYSRAAANPYNSYSEIPQAVYSYLPQYPSFSYNPMLNYGYPQTVYPAYNPTFPIANSFNNNMQPATSVTPTTPSKIANTPSSSPHQQDVKASSTCADDANSPNPQAYRSSSAPGTVAITTATTELNATSAVTSNETTSVPAPQSNNVAPNAPPIVNEAGLVEGDPSSINTPLITTNGETGTDINSLPPQVKEFIEMIPDILSMPESQQFSGEVPHPPSVPSGVRTIPRLPPSHKHQKLLPLIKKKYHSYYPQKYRECYQ